MDSWIPTELSLPKDDKGVLVAYVDKTGYYCVVHAIYFDSIWYEKAENSVDIQCWPINFIVTHWRYKPCPPVTNKGA